jgi:hypothetical protein
MALSMRRIDGVQLCDSHSKSPGILGGISLHASVLDLENRFDIPGHFRPFLEVHVEL